MQVGLSGSKDVRTETGFSINYRNKKVNAYGSYSGNYGKLQSEFQLHRLVKDTAFDHQTQILQNKENHVFKAGLDYTLDSKSNIGVMVSGNITTPRVTIENTTPISYHPTGMVDKILLAGNDTKHKNSNTNKRSFLLLYPTQ